VPIKSNAVFAENCSNLCEEEDSGKNSVPNAKTRGKQTRPHLHKKKKELTKKKIEVYIKA